MKPFVYEQPPARIVFGVGRFGALAEELERLGASRALVLSTPGQRALAESAANLSGARCAGIYAGARMHVPVEIAREALAQAARLGADCAIAVGGGSTVGLAKAIALEVGLPILAVPTTYAGSEMTPIYGLTEGEQKRTGRDRRVQPKTVIYDPQLTVNLAPATSVTSGFNAIAHAAEGLYAADANPATSLMAQEGIRAIAQALPRIVHNPSDLAAREDCLYGAWLCGTVLGTVGMGLHHKLCHVLGGTWNLPHAETHTVILPHALAYNVAAAPEAMKRIARALDASDAPRALWELARRLGAPTSLAAIGMKEENLDRAAALAAESPYANPRPVTRSAIRALLEAAFHGRAPSG